MAIKRHKKLINIWKTYIKKPPMSFSFNGNPQSGGSLKQLFVSCSYRKVHYNFRWQSICNMNIHVQSSQFGCKYRFISAIGSVFASYSLLLINFTCMKTFSLFRSWVHLKYSSVLLLYPTQYHFVILQFLKSSFYDNSCNVRCLRTSNE